MNIMRDVTCVDWIKSSYSGGNGGQCVEFSRDFAGIVPVRDSKMPASHVLIFDSSAWGAFIDSVKNGTCGT